MRQFFLLALAMPSVYLLPTDHECHSDNLKDRFRRCIEETDLILFNQSVEQVQDSAPVCALLGLFVDGCTAMYRQCYPEQEHFDRFRANQISTFVHIIGRLSHDMDLVVNNCPMAQNVTKDLSSTLCRSEDMEQLVDRYLDCIGVAYNEIEVGVMNNDSEAISTVCNGIFRAFHGVKAQKQQIRQLMSTNKGTSRIDVSRCSVYGGDIGPTLDWVDDALSVVGHADHFCLLAALVTLVISA